MGIRNRHVMPETIGKEAGLYWKARCRTDCSALEGGGGGEGGELGGGGKGGGKGGGGKGGGEDGEGGGGGEGVVIVEDGWIKKGTTEHVICHKMSPSARYNCCTEGHDSPSTALSTCTGKPIKTVLLQTGKDDVNWVNQAQDRHQLQPAVHTVMKLSVLCKMEKVVTI
jgi:hypothetical protein